MILDSGTVDQPETRDLACEILEGGKKAYELEKPDLRLCYSPVVFTLIGT